MRKIVGIATAALAVGMAAGCQQQQQPKQALSSRAVLDVRPPHRTTPTYAPPQRVTPPEEPQLANVTGPVTTVTPVAAVDHPAKPGKKAVASAQKGNSYKVKKGDTLYHIAKTEYGDGKKWTTIASANPGISPTSLKAGQTLVIP